MPGGHSSGQEFIGLLLGDAGVFLKEKDPVYVPGKLPGHCATNDSTTYDGYFNIACKGDVLCFLRITWEMTGPKGDKILLFPGSTIEKMPIVGQKKELQYPWYSSERSKLIFRGIVHDSYVLIW